jgi:hypothetical protein
LGEPGNKKDLAVYPGMTTRPREEMEGDVGNEPSKRYKNSVMDFQSGWGEF